jgi:hypothetical protein
MISKSLLVSRLVFTGFAAMILSLAIAATALAKDPKACTAASTAALKSCQSDATSDFWIGKGKCSNLSDAEARKECETDAKDEQQEAKQDCKDQKEARSEVCDLLGENPYDPQINPADFVQPSQIGDTVQANPHFPLIAGKSWTYAGAGETIAVDVTQDTKVILGVTCAVVRDVVKEGDEVVEDTEDWFAQDINGNVWYFGEISQEFENGELVSLEGSWKAGVDGAKPGIIMKAAPQVGDVYRQEFLLGEAEDVAEVLSLTGSAVVPAASCDGNCLITKDYTPLEPDGEENKYYAPGIGLILEVNVETGERVELVEFE